ncbi:hypothetical protein HMPREF3198_01075 [Winkia neuii]|nr:hypothetical protein HMPREF3198_01075 [Winkia neuii]
MWCGTQHTSYLGLKSWVVPLFGPLIDEGGAVAVRARASWVRSVGVLVRLEG